MVFEDDVVLCAGFRERLEALELPDDWAMCYFGCVFQGPPEVVSPGLLRVRSGTWDMHGYLIRKEFAQRMGPRLREVDRRRGVCGAELTAIDVVLGGEFGNVPIYAVWPPMAWQVEGLSNNEHAYRGNYFPDGTQRIHRRAIRDLPGGGERSNGIREEERPAAEAQPWSAGTCPGFPAGATGRLGSDNVARAGETANGKAVAGDGGGREGRSASPGDMSPLPKAESCLRSPGGSGGDGRGILVSPYSAESERMAYALVRSLRKYNRRLPVHVVSQDYVCGLDWRGMATVRAVRAAGAHGTPEKWLNKLSGIRRSPFEETIFLDCDIVLLSDPEWWFGHLGTDDFTWFHQWHGIRDVPDETIYNVVNPHRMKEEFGVDAVAVQGDRCPAVLCHPGSAPPAR